MTKSQQEQQQEQDEAQYEALAKEHKDLILRINQGEFGFDQEGFREARALEEAILEELNEIGEKLGHFPPVQPKIPRSGLPP